MASENRAGADEQVRQGPSAQPSSAGAKVTVYCNLPAGIVLQAFRMVPSRELVMGGGSRDIMVAEQTGEPFVVHGTAAPRTLEGLEVHRHRIVAGFAVTEGVPKDLWESWAEANKQSPMVRNKCIFAYEKAGMGDGQAKEQRTLRTGLEPFMPENDPRRPRPRANMSDVKTDNKEDAA